MKRIYSRAEIEMEQSLTEKKKLWSVAEPEPVLFGRVRCKGVNYSQIQLNLFAKIAKYRIGITAETSSIKKT